MALAQLIHHNNIVMKAYEEYKINEHALFKITGGYANEYYHAQFTQTNNIFCYLGQRLGDIVTYDTLIIKLLPIANAYNLFKESLTNAYIELTIGGTNIIEIPLKLCMLLNSSFIDNTVYIKLPFEYLLNEIYLIALQYHDLRIGIGFKTNISAIISEINMSCIFVCLDHDDRKKLAQMSHTICFQQIQTHYIHNQFEITHGELQIIDENDIVDKNDIVDDATQTSSQMDYSEDGDNKKEKDKKEEDKEITEADLRMDLMKNNTGTTHITNNETNFREDIHDDKFTYTIKCHFSFLVKGYFIECNVVDLENFEYQILNITRFDYNKSMIYLYTHRISDNLIYAPLNCKVDYKTIDYASALGNRDTESKFILTFKNRQSIIGIHAINCNYLMYGSGMGVVRYQRDNRLNKHIVLGVSGTVSGLWTVAYKIINIEQNNECAISYEKFKKNCIYCVCNNCKYNFIKNNLEIYFKMSNSYNCPMCKKSWENKKVYINNYMIKK